MLSVLTSAANSSSIADSEGLALHCGSSDEGGFVRNERLHIVDKLKF